MWRSRTGERRNQRAGWSHLYGAIKTDIANLDDPTLKEGITHLKELRDQIRAACQHTYVAEPNHRATESELRLKCLYEAIKTSIADLNTPWDQAQATLAETCRNRIGPSTISLT